MLETFAPFKHSLFLPHASCHKPAGAANVKFPFDPLVCMCLSIYINMYGVYIYIYIWALVNILCIFLHSSAALASSLPRYFRACGAGSFLSASEQLLWRLAAVQAWDKWLFSGSGEHVPL